jgi:hypothetical protein
MEFVDLIWVGVTGAASIFGYIQSRRFVDAVQKPVAPVVAGGTAALLAAPVVWLLPIIGAGTAVIFGLGIGAGVHHGARDVKRLPGA